MLLWAFFFLLLSLITGMFTYWSNVPLATHIAGVTFIVCVVLFVAAYGAGIVRAMRSDS